MVSSPLETDAEDKTGVPRIEVTPEMIEAGKAELVCFEWLECDPADAARRVYLAMTAACHASEITSLVHRQR